MKVDGQLVWVQSNHGHKAVCAGLKQLGESLLEYEKEKEGHKKELVYEHVAAELFSIQDVYWQIPVNLVVKHFTSDIRIQIGMHLGVG